MNREDAHSWLRGERSMNNIIPQDPFETWQVRVAQADAAKCQEAYWVAKANSEIVIDAPASSGLKEVMQPRAQRQSSRSDWSGAEGGNVKRVVRTFILKIRKVLRGHAWACRFANDPTSTTDCTCSYRSPNDKAQLRTK